MHQKYIIEKYFQTLNNIETTETVMAPHLTDQFVWRGPQPFQSCRSFDQWLILFWLPLIEAFSSLRRETHIVIGGVSHGKADNSIDGRCWVGATGYYHAIFQRAWLGCEPTGQPIRCRWGEFFRFENDLIVEKYTLLDILDWLQQIGKSPLPPSRGVDFFYPAPSPLDWQLLGQRDSAETATSMRLIRNFLFDGLNNFDRENLSSMAVERFFHRDLKWYGPGGIGACLSLEAFQTNHQQPWLTAYPDRKVQDLDSLFADGHFAAASG